MPPGPYSRPAEGDIFCSCKTQWASWMFYKLFTGDESFWAAGFYSRWTASNWHWRLKKKKKKSRNCMYWKGKKAKETKKSPGLPKPPWESSGTEGQQSFQTWKLHPLLKINWKMRGISQNPKWFYKNLDCPNSWKQSCCGLFFFFCKGHTHAMYILSPIQGRQDRELRRRPR